VKPNAIIIGDHDNVAIVLTDMKKGNTVCIEGGMVVEALEDIPFSHKVALVDLCRGMDIIKYGEIIGQAKKDIKAGDWVHIHNLVVED
jgi:altronate dehydratase